MCIDDAEAEAKAEADADVSGEDAGGMPKKAPKMKESMFSE